MQLNHLRVCAGFDADAPGDRFAATSRELVRRSRARTNAGAGYHADVEAIVHVTYEQASGLEVVCLFAALGLSLSAAVISMVPADALSWVAAHLHLHMGLPSGH